MWQEALFICFLLESKFTYKYSFMKKENSLVLSIFFINSLWGLYKIWGVVSSFTCRFSPNSECQ